jgi:hypothetical protein
MINVTDRVRVRIRVTIGVRVITRVRISIRVRVRVRFTLFERSKPLPPLLRPSYPPESPL